MRRPWWIKGFAVIICGLCLVTTQLPTTAQAAQVSGMTLPDDKTGYQIQLVYVETSSAEGSNFDTTGQIAMWVDQIQAWLKAKTGKELIFDTYKGKLDIVRLNYIGNIQKSKNDDEKLVQMYRARNPTTYFGKTLAFVVDQKQSVGSTLCGWAQQPSDYALIFPNLKFSDGGQCKDLEENAKVNNGFSYEAQSILHEIVHSYGVSHVCVDSTDLMQGSPECEKLGVTKDYTKPVTFDSSRRNYFGGDKSGANLKLLKIWSDGSGERHPDLLQGVCWAGELCPFEENTFDERGTVQLQIKNGQKWVVVNSAKDVLSTCKGCLKYYFLNSYTFPKPGNYQFRIVKLKTTQYLAYVGPTKTIKVLK